MTDELSDYLVAKNQEEIEKKDLPAAEEAATELVQDSKEEALSWFVKGKTLYLEGKFEDALTHLSKAAELDQENETIWHIIGFDLLALQRYSQAAESLEYVKAKNPKGAGAIYALGLAYLFSGDSQKALENMKLAYSLNRELILKMAESAYAQAFELSQDVSRPLKAQIERSLETLKVAKMNGAFVKD